jgi:hypothetical protein
MSRDEAVLASHSLEESLRTHGDKGAERDAQPQRSPGASAARRRAGARDHAARCSYAVVYSGTRSSSLGVTCVERSLLAGRLGQVVDVDEVGVDVDEAGHALAAGGDETQLGDGLHLSEATRPPG